MLIYKKIVRDQVDCLAQKIVANRTFLFMEQKKNEIVLFENLAFDVSHKHELLRGWLPLKTKEHQYHHVFAFALPSVNVISCYAMLWQ